MTLDLNIQLPLCSPEDVSFKFIVLTCEKGRLTVCFLTLLRKYGYKKDHLKVTT